jgi:hypothetical protein
MSEDKKVEFEQLAQTKGTFVAKGKLFNLKSENAFKEIKTSNGKQMRMANIGLRIADGEVMYLSLNGMEKDFVYFSKKGEKGQKAVTEKVEWAKRNRFSKDGYRLIGIGLALHKDEETKKNEDVKTFEAFDAIEYIQENAEDNMSVTVKGTVEFSSFEDKNTKEMKHGVKYVPTGMYLNGTEIDFQAEGFKKDAQFAQPVIFNAARKEDDKFFLDVSVVGYKTIEDASLETTEQLAKIMKDKVKPFSGIILTGEIRSAQVVEEVVAEVWGERRDVGKAKTPSRVIMFVDGARPESVNTETYPKKAVEAYREACAAEKNKKASKNKDFESQEGGSESWGKKNDVAVEESGW